MHTRKVLFYTLITLLIVEIVWLFLWPNIPAIVAKVPVALPQSEAVKMYVTCMQKNYKEDCYALAFFTLTKKTDMKFAKKTLLSLQQIDPKQSAGCHLMAHNISAAEVERKPLRWRELLGEQEYNFCSGGFIHGILEAHIGQDPSFALDHTKFEDICSSVKIGKASCFHNLGHLLLVEKYNSIPASVAECNLLTNPTAHYQCLSGMFMENLTRLNLKSHKLAKPFAWNLANARKIESLCKTYIGEAEKACFVELSYMYASVYGTVPEDVYSACQRAPTKEIGDECYLYGAGNMLTFSQFKKEYLRTICSPFEENDLYERCVQHVINAMMASSSQFIPWEEYFCDNVKQAQKKPCFSYIEKRLKENEK